MEGQIFLIVIQFIRAFNFLCLIESPSLQLIVQYIEIFPFLWVHPSLNFYLPLLLLFLFELFLSPSQLSIFVIPDFSKLVCSLSCKPRSNSALNVQSGLFPLLCPHFRREISLIWFYDLVFPCIHVQSSLFALDTEANIHLNTHFPHHNGRLSFVFVGLDDSLVLLGVVIGLLIGLCESVVVCHSCPVIPISTKVRFHLFLFLNFNSHTFNLK